MATSPSRVALRHLQNQPDYGESSAAVPRGDRQADIDPSPRRRRERETADLLLGPGWRVLSDTGRETVYGNDAEGCVIRAPHGGRGSIILECSNGYRDTFKFVPTAVEAVRKGLHRRASREAFNKYNPVELLSQLLAVLEQEGLEDAAKAVKSITRVVNEEWKKRGK